MVVQIAKAVLGATVDHDKSPFCTFIKRDFLFSIKYAYISLVYGLLKQNVSISFG